VFGRVGPGMAEGARGAPQEVSDADTHCGLNVDAGESRGLTRQGPGKDRSRRGRPNLRPEGET